MQHQKAKQQSFITNNTPGRRFSFSLRFSVVYRLLFVAQAHLGGLQISQPFILCLSVILLESIMFMEH